MCVNVTVRKSPTRACTMLRNTFAAISAAIAGGSVAHTPALTASPKQAFLVSRQEVPYQHTAPGRLYHYRSSCAETPLEFRVKYRMDLMGNYITEQALNRALEDHYTLFGPIREKYVVLQTGDWNGHFTIDENTDPRTLILRLTKTADERLEEVLMAPQLR